MPEPEKFVDVEAAMKQLPPDTASPWWWRKIHYFIYKALVMTNEGDHMWVRLPMEDWELEAELSAKPSPWQYRFTIWVVKHFRRVGLWVLDELRFARNV